MIRPRNTKLKLSPPIALEWREHGRWHKAGIRFRSEKGANEHAEIIGANTYRLIEISRVLKTEEWSDKNTIHKIIISSKPRTKTIVR